MYEVYFNGFVADQTSVEEIKGRLKSRFGLDDRRLSDLFSGEGKIIKRHADLDFCQRFAAAVGECGLPVTVRPSAPAAEAPTPPATRPAQPRAGSATRGAGSAARSARPAPAADDSLESRIIAFLFKAFVAIAAVKIVATILSYAEFGQKLAGLGGRVLALAAIIWVIYCIAVGLGNARNGRLTVFSDLTDVAATFGTFLAPYFVMLILSFLFEDMVRDSEFLYPIFKAGLSLTALAVFLIFLYYVILNTVLDNGLDFFDAAVACTAKLALSFMFLVVLLSGDEKKRRRSQRIQHYLILAALAGMIAYLVRDYSFRPASEYFRRSGAALPAAET